MKLKLGDLLEDLTPDEINSFFKTATIGSIIFFVILIVTTRIILGFPLHSGSFSDFLEKIELLTEEKESKE